MTVVPFLPVYSFFHIFGLPYLTERFYFINQVPVMSWFDDTSDQELVNLIPYLEMIAESDDVYTVLKQSGFTSQATETTNAMQLQMQMQNSNMLPQVSSVF